MGWRARRASRSTERLSRKFFQVKRYICYTLPLSNAKIYAWPVTMTQQQEFDAWMEEEGYEPGTFRRGRLLWVD